MKPEEKELLLKDLCARLPYGVIMTNIELPETHYPLTCRDVHDIMFEDLDDVPYLRPLSSMTEEEKNELKEYLDAEEVDCNGFGYSEGGTLEDYISSIPYSICVGVVDWLNKKMFDFRGLIPKGIALSTDEYNPYSN